MDKLNKALIYLLVLIVLAGVWELSVYFNNFLALFISSPSRLYQYLNHSTYFLAISLGYTAVESVLGLLIASSVGVAFWYISYVSPKIGSIIYPFLASSQVIPFICLAPLIVIIFGFGITGKIVLSAIMAFFPIVTNLLIALRTVNRDAIDYMCIVNATDLQTLKYVIWPHSLKYFFAAQRTAVPFAIIGALVAEFSGAQYGIGKNLFIASRRLEPELLMSNILASFILAGGFYAMLLFLESQIGKWYRRTDYA